MVKRAQCGLENDPSNSPLVVFSRLIGKKTQEINRRDMLKFMSWKGGSMAFLPGEPAHGTKCAGCGIGGVLFTKIKNPKTGKEEWYCTASCALRAKDSKGRGLGGNHVKQQSPITREEKRKMRKKKAAEAADNGGVPEKATGKKKGNRGEHLTPKEAVKFPKELLKHPKIGEALKTLTTCDRSSREGAKARLALRNAGFKLSDEATWKPFLKGVKA